MNVSNTQVDYWLDGARQSGTAPFGEVFNPASGAVVARVPFADAEQVDAAVAGAVRAAESWRSVPVGRRAQLMFRFRELMVRHTDELAAIITREHGKVLDDARGELARGLEVVESACGAIQLLKAERSESVSGGIDVHSVRRPLGVVAGITPFNFPVMVPLWMFPLALVCGNAFVLKPSERVPSASVRLAELLGEAGAPPGLLQVVHGERPTAEALLAHPDIAAVSFVGSTPAARNVYSTGTANDKRVQALGGAKNHMVVAPDADLDKAAEAAANAGYGAAGQRCMAVSVVVAVGDVADPLVGRIAERAGGIRTGDGAEPDIEMGPLITAAQQDRVHGLVVSGVAEGAKLVVDGRGLQVPERAGGFFIGPCLFDEVTPKMAIYREEIFGPVLCVVRVKTLDEAITLIRENPYGNGASLYTRDGAAARHFETEAEAGMIGINVPIPVPHASHSFGGWGQSLFGDLHIYGPDGVRFYTRGKAVTTRWEEGGGSGLNLGAKL